MDRKLGIGRCGLACCACSQEVRSNGSEYCNGCESEKCALAPTCKSLRCSKEKGLAGCYECDSMCEEGVLKKTKVKGFIAFIKKYGTERFIDCLEANEKAGIIYHKNGAVGDYDACESIEEVMDMLNGNLEKE